MDLAVAIRCPDRREPPSVDPVKDDTVVDGSVGAIG